jgi:hypothetical protein
MNDVQPCEETDEIAVRDAPLRDAVDANARKKEGKVQKKKEPSPEAPHGGHIRPSPSAYQIIDFFALGPRQAIYLAQFRHAPQPAACVNLQVLPRPPQLPPEKANESHECQIVAQVEAAV